MGYRHDSPHCVIFKNHYESRKNAKSLRCVILNTNQLQVFKIQTRFVFRGLPHLLRFQNSGRKSRFHRLFTLLHCTATVNIRLKSFSNACVSTPRIKKYVLNLKPSLVEDWGKREDFLEKFHILYKIGFVIHTEVHFQRVTKNYFANHITTWCTLHFILLSLNF